jgi:hypothetical protein
MAMISSSRFCKVDVPISKLPPAHPTLPLPTVEDYLKAQQGKTYTSKELMEAPTFVMIESSTTYDWVLEPSKYLSRKKKTASNSPFHPASSAERGPSSSFSSSSFSSSANPHAYASLRTSRYYGVSKQSPNPKSQVPSSNGYLTKVKLTIKNYVRETMLRCVDNLKKALLRFVNYLMMTAWVVIATIGILHSILEILSIVNSHGVCVVVVLAVAAFCLREEIPAVLEQIKRVEAKVDATSEKFTKCIEILKMEKLRIICRLL